MRRILKSGVISVSDDIVTIPDIVSRRPARVSGPKDGEGAGSEENAEAEAHYMADAETEAIAEMIIQKAIEQADRIIGDAQQRVQDERAAILQQAQEEAAQMLERARQEGALDGARGQIETVRSCISDLETAVSRLEGELAGFTSEYEQNLKWMALEIASKVLNKRIQDDDTEMEELVRAAVNGVKSAQWISVQVSDAMPGLLDTLTNSLRTADGVRVEIQDVPGPPGTCIVETPDGVVDASLYTQLENLKEYFKNE